MAESSDVQRFEFEGATLRVLMIDEEPWFVARDAIHVLGLSNTTQALSRLYDDEYTLVNAALISNEYRPQDTVNIITESGLYSLILSSRKPEARRFKRWVTREVLPQIRKTGSYGVQRELTRRELLEMALEAETAREAAVERARTLELESRLAHEQRVQAVAEAASLRPRAEGYDQLLNADGLYSLAAAAQAVGLGRQRLIQRLAEWRCLIVKPKHSDHLRPYQDQITAGRFAVKAGQVEIEHRSGDRETIATATTYVTPKGLDFIRRKLNSSTA